MSARRVAVYEFIASGGWTDVYGAPPPESLAIEGRAMLGALAADFAAAGCETLVLADGAGISDLKFEISDLKSQISNLDYGPLQQAHLEVLPVAPGTERAGLEAAARRADWTVVIAPEFDRLLATRCDWVRSAGRLLGPSAAAIDLAADKVALGEHWLAAGVPTPPGVLIRGGQRLPVAGEFQYPAVCKPRWGCGSQEISLVRGTEPADHAVWQPAAGDRRLERYCPGQPASVAFLCGPQGVVPLPPCRQRLGKDGSFAYLGGETPLAAALAERAVRLATRAVQAAGQDSRSHTDWLGYIGVDLVLGDEPAGHADVAIELNPRLTTSYVGLRAALNVNLASAMLAVAEGQPLQPPHAARRVSFRCDGRVT